jgi:hypothetical protein
VILCAAFGLTAEDAVQRGDEETGDGADKEGLTPAPCSTHLSAGEVAQSSADGNGDVKDGEDAVAIALGVEVCDDSRREDGERGFANADDCMAEVESPVVVNPGGGESGEAPEHGAADDERLATEAISEPAGERSSQHVDEEHGRGERAHLLARRVEFILDEG